VYRSWFDTLTTTGMNGRGFPLVMQSPIANRRNGIDRSGGA
jgi:hypothetical protein